MWQLDGPLELLECDEQVDVVRQGRATPGDVQYVDGIPAASHPPSRQSVVATLQPMMGLDLQMVPEGNRHKQTWWLWQATRTAAQASFLIDTQDLVLYGEQAYQVQKVEPWQSYRRCMLVGVDLGTYAGIIAAATTPDVYPDLSAVEDPIQVGAIPLGDQMANYLYDAAGLPADNLGNVGDLYLDTDTYTVYGPKTTAGWPASGKTLVGPAGPVGPPGPSVTGPQGPVGTIIFRGAGLPPSDAILQAARDEDYYLDLNTGSLYPFIDDANAASSDAPLSVGAALDPSAAAR